MTSTLPYRNKGVTALELMLAVLVLAIVLAFSVPSFSNLLKDNRIETRTSEFATDLAFARSEAIKRRAKIEVSAATWEPTQPASWSKGWTVSDVTSQAVLRASSATSNETFDNAEGITQLTFLPNGYIKLSGINATATTFQLCDDRHSEYGQVIHVSASGQIERKVQILCP